MYNFTLAASAHCQQGKLGTTLETINNAEPLQDRQHAILTLHRRRSASHFGTCDSRPAISQETHSRGETPVEIPRHGPSFQIWGLLCPSLSADQGQMWHTRQSARYHLSCQILQWSVCCVIWTRIIHTKLANFLKFGGFCTLEQTLSTCQISPYRFILLPYGGENLQILTQF